MTTHDQHNEVTPPLEQVEPATQLPIVRLSGQIRR